MRRSTVGRLQRVVATAGELSLKKAHGTILNGHVSLNGKVCYNPAMPTTPEDVVLLRGHALNRSTPTPARLWRHFKPPGLITSRVDTRSRPTVFDQLPAALPRNVISVGRLDRDTEGLLLLTDNGPLAWYFMHPSSGIVREYHACVATREQRVTHSMLERLEHGITLRDGTRYAPMSVDLLARGFGVEDGALEPCPDGHQWVRMRLTEGKKHEVRRVWREFGFGTARLVRVSYGPFGVDDLKPGDVDAVCGEQVEALCAEAEEARARYYRERASASEHE
jgi:23S rRNA pseudouridine2605 synthase